MADGVKFTPDHDGITAWLVANVAGEIQGLGEAVAADIASQRYHVKTEAVAERSTKDGRPRCAVHVERGFLLQARDGVLTRAASAQGLEVSG